MTAPVRDPRQVQGEKEGSGASLLESPANRPQRPASTVSGMLGPCSRCGKPTGSLARVCIRCAEAEQHWAWTLTPEGRAELRRACVAIRRLVDHEDNAALWQCASDCLRDLNTFADQIGETA